MGDYCCRGFIVCRLVFLVSHPHLPVDGPRIRRHTPLTSHLREAEQELVAGQGDLGGYKMGYKSSVSPDITMSHDIPDMVTREEVEQLLEAQKTAILQGLTVSLRNAPGAVEPFKAVVEELEKVHHRGFEPLTFGSVDRCSIQLS